MSNVEPRFYRSQFISNTKSTKRRLDDLGLERNTIEKKRELESLTKGDVKIDIAGRVKDFSRIKEAVDKVPDIDNSDKIIDLKNKIKNNLYEIDYDKVIDKIILYEF
ncbi:MAG: flagellar biosynthesis anti-sigma factor FlgM [Bacteriovoracales bacterium]|nr:flagellar biosynthesis anti-sigma factor FlgM [Bacteriovoracales bacterium]